ncbi:MAG: hypothetical protein ABII74_10335 [Elusimicrobiota bacterium]
MKKIKFLSLLLLAISGSLSIEIIADRLLRSWEAPNIFLLVALFFLLPRFFAGFWIGIIMRKNSWLWGLIVGMVSLGIYYYSRKTLGWTFAPAYLYFFSFGAYCGEKYIKAKKW